MGRRTLGTLVATLVVAAGVPLVGAAPAAASTYRFWSYWHGDSGSWAFSGVGADSWRLKDGAVEGWRFAVSPGTGAAPPPRLAPGTVWSLDGCADKVAGQGEVRAAVVIDFGHADDYADGQRPPADPVRVWCGVLPTRSTGMDLLNAATSGSVRTDGGMVCGISGYPSRGCGEVVADPTPTRTSTPKPTATRTSTPKPTRTADPTSTTRPSHSSRPTPAATTPAGTAPTGAGPTVSAPTSGDTVAPPAATGSATAASGASSEPTPPADDDSPVPVVGLPVAADSSTGSPWPLLAVAVLLAGLGGTVYWRRRTR